jgi:hypothetical protein
MKFTTDGAIQVFLQAFITMISYNMKKKHSRNNLKEDGEYTSLGN